MLVKINFIYGTVVWFSIKLHENSFVDELNEKYKCYQE